MRIENLQISDTNDDRQYTAQQLIDIMDAGPGGGGGGGGSARVEMTASYQTNTVSPTIYYTALNSDGSSLTARGTSGIVFVAGLYTYTQATVAITDFIAIWDEGNVNDYRAEWIVVDT